MSGMISGGMLCYCNPCPGLTDDEKDKCWLKPGGQCFSAIREEYNTEENIYESTRSFGCISEYDNALLQCKGDLVPSKNLQSVACCNFTDMCNKDLKPELKPRSFIQPSNSSIDTNLFCWTALVILFLAFSFLTFYVLTLRFKLPKQKVSRKCFMKPCTNKRQKKHNLMYDLTSTTGSGAGKPLLVQSTIGRQFNRRYCLGRGRFTEVNVGRWNASTIAEKIFSTSEEKRWLQETKIYEAALLQHKNILGFITSDILESGLRAIYTEYHELGSLHDYLHKTSLNTADFFRLVESAATAISYLHAEILGSTKLPPIAHRDITSKNFLISNCRECVIYNFEIAVIPIRVGEDTVVEPDITLGTPRYMAPEVVNGTIKRDSFDAFKMSDIYSFGLVLYEMCQRCTTVEGDQYSVDEHKLPYFERLPKNPSINSMKELFALKKSSDELLPIPQRWENNKLLKSFANILRECFINEIPKARPSALRLKKSLIRLISSHRQGLIGETV